MADTWHFNKQLRIAMIVVILSVTVNVAFAQTKKIDEPLFFEHFYEHTYGDPYDYEIHYITNSSDTRRLRSLDFHTEDIVSFQISQQDSNISGFMFSNQNNNPYYDEVGRYYTHKIGYLNLKVYGSAREKIENGETIILERATAVFDDRSTMDIDIGKIVIKPQSDIEYAKFSSSSGSSSGDNTAKVSTANDKTIQSITSNFFPDINENLRYTIRAVKEVDGVRQEQYEQVSFDELTFPVEVGRSMVIRIDFVGIGYDAIEGDEATAYRYASQGGIYINCIDSKGTELVYRFHHDTWMRNLDEEYVEEYVEYRRKTDE